MASSISTSLYSNWMKEVWGPKIFEAFLKKSRLYTILNGKPGRVSKVDAEGKSFILPLDWGFGEGWGSRPEGGTLPTPIQMDIEQSIVPVKEHFKRHRITGKAILAAGQKGAVVPSFPKAMKDIRESHPYEMGRQWFGDGTGALAYFTAVDSTSPATTDDGDGNSFSYVRKNMRCLLMDTSDDKRNWNNVVVSGATASTVTWSAATLDNSSGDGDYLVREDSNDGTNAAAATAWHEMQGLKGIVSASNPPTGNLQGINRSTAGNEQWKSEDVNASDAALTEDMMLQALQNVERNGGSVDVIITSQAIWRKFGLLLSGDRRFGGTGRRVTYRGGFSALALAFVDGDVPVFSDPMCWPQLLFALDTSSFHICQLNDPGFIEEDGKTIFYLGRGDSGTDEYEIIWGWKAELGVGSPNKTCLIRNIKIT